MQRNSQRIPKNGERVSAHAQRGTFVISAVNVDRWTVQLQKIGRNVTVDDIEWGALTFLDDLDESQNALRVVREATEGS